jgi:multiple sugar transport system substrate-binding protein
MSTDERGDAVGSSAGEPASVGAAAGAQEPAAGPARMPLSRRRFLGVAGAGLLGAATVGSKGLTGSQARLAPGGTLRSNATKPTTLTFWNSYTASDRPFVEAIVAKYNSSQSKVHISMTIMPGDVLADKLEVSLATGSGPDISTVPNGAVQEVAEFADAGVIQPVDFAYGSGGVDKSVFPQAFFPAVTWKGKLYAVPMTIQSVGLYYNPDMFKAAGVAPPATTGDLLSAAEKLTKNGISGMPLATTGVIDWWSLFLWAYGGNYTNSADTTATLDSPASVTAFEAWGNADKKYKVSPPNLTGSQGDSLFSTKRAAIDFSGPWVISGFQAAKVPFEVMGFPSSTGRPIALGTGGSMILSAKTSALDEARDFFAFWTSPWAVLEYAKSGSNAMRTDMAAEVSKLGKYPAAFQALLPHIRYSLTGLLKFSQFSAEVTNIVQAVEAGQNVKSVLSSGNSKLQSYLS